MIPRPRHRTDRCYLADDTPVDVEYCIQPAEPDVGIMQEYLELESVLCVGTDTYLDLDLHEDFISDQIWENIYGL